MGTLALLKNSAKHLNINDWTISGYENNYSFFLGSIASLDDFYLTSAGLATTETTLFVYNKELYRNLSSDFAVYEPIRVMVANRLAQFASQWGKMFEKYKRRKLKLALKVQSRRNQFKR